MAFFRSLRLRLTLWYVLLLAITLALFSAAVYIALRQVLYQNLSDSLENRSTTVAGLVKRDNEVNVAGISLPGDPVEGEQYVRVYNASGNMVYDNSPEGHHPSSNPNGVSAALAGRTSERDDDAPGVSLRTLTVPVRADSGIVGAVEVGLPRDDVTGTLELLLIIIAVAYPLALVVAGAGGVFLAGRALSPINEVTQAARKISAEDLSRRLNMDLPDDEVGRLARTFDEMIARLDEAFRRQRQFTADASHELRTPLTAIKGQTEVALQRDREAGAYRDVLRTVNSEVDRMTGLVESLLTLARADAGQIPLAAERISLGEVASDAAQQVTPAAEAKGISVDVQSGGEVWLTGDQDLLLQLILNLLDNAVKYTPVGGSVSVGWRRDGRDAFLQVVDTGPGIAPEHLSHLFDRFYRVEAARTSTGGGVGLGLSICRWIAEAHGGSIRAESTPGSGSTFTVRLPAS